MSNGNQEELTSILQLVIDAPALQPYLHPESAGRTPLVVVARAGVALSLRKFDQPVTIVDQAPAMGAYLEVSEIRRSASGYTIEIRYPIEGIRGRFEIARDPQGRWVIQSHELTET